MRSFSVRSFWPAWWAVLMVIAALALTACAGDDSSDDPAGAGDNVALANEGAVNGDTAGQSASATDPADVVAAIVNGEPISREAFEAERARRTVGMSLEPATQSAYDDMILDGLIDQVLIDQYAAQNGISVPDAEIDAELAAQADIAAQNNQSLDEFIAAQLYTPAQYREAVRDVLLWAKVSQAVVANVPTMSMQVHSRHILVTDEALARDLLGQIQQGTNFAQLAIQYSLDKSSAPAGGDLDWVSEGEILQPEVEAAIFSLAPGQLSPEPVRSSLGWHIIEVLESVEGRPLDQAALAERKSQAFLQWLENQRAAAVIEKYVGTVAQ